MKVRNSLLVISVIGLSYIPSYAGCTLKLTSPADNATVNTAGITVYGNGGADAKYVDKGSVVATLNGATIFTYSGSFTTAISFLQGRGVGVTLRPGLNFISASGSVGGCSASDSITVYYDSKNEIILAKNLGAPAVLPSCNIPNSFVGNPINVALGNKFQKEEDISGSGTYPLNFQRVYNSIDGYWRHNYSARLQISGNTITLINADGREDVFTNNNGVISSSASQFGTLTKTSDGWQYKTPFNDLWEFDATGRLVQTTNGAGLTHQLTYAMDGSITVSDKFNHTLTIVEYDTNHQPASVTTSGGQLVTFEYDSSDRLIKKIKNGKTKTYHYENTTLPRALTGITDERGIRYVTWKYDDQGRATQSSYAGDVDTVKVVYNTDGSVDVINPLGRVSKYSYTTIGGVKLISSIVGDKTSNCAMSNATFEYESRGLLSSKTNSLGVTTSYQYNDLGQEISNTQASNTDEAKTTTTSWYSEQNLPRSVTTNNRSINYDYDAQGRITSYIIQSLN